MRILERLLETIYQLKQLEILDSSGIAIDEDKSVGVLGGKPSYQIY